MKEIALIANQINAQGFDIIGDIHGFVEPLKKLLTKLGYQETESSWAHPERKAIFVGDLIDRGLGEKETCELVRKMVEANQAHICIGNHELNAIGYSIEDGQGDYLRKHSDKNNKQHKAFLAEFPFGSDSYKDMISWFKSLPLWLELSVPSGQKARVIHACWHSDSIEKLKPFLKQTSTAFILGEDVDIRLFKPNTDAFKLIEIILKGPEKDLPKGSYYIDKGGIQRTQSRINWWSPANTWGELAILGGFKVQGLDLNTPVESDFSIYEADLPVFFGHYWRSGDLSVETEKVACLDWSIAKGGQLVAYRWDGEQVLDVGKMVAVSAD